MLPVPAALLLLAWRLAADLITAGTAAAAPPVTAANVDLLPLLPLAFSLRARRFSKALSAGKSSTLGRIRRGGSMTGGRPS